MTSAIIADASVSSLVSEQIPYIHHKRGFVCGVGVNDFPTSTMVDGKSIKAYKTWHNMLNRCYSQKYQTTHQASGRGAKTWYSVLQ